MRSLRATAITITLAATMLLTAGTASARDNNPNISFGDDCYSWGPTCHTVFSRSYTHNVLQPAASGTAQGLLASVIGLCTKVWKAPGAATCSMIFGTYGGASIAAISQAAAQNQCAQYVSYFTDAIAVWSTNNGPLCKP